MVLNLSQQTDSSDLVGGFKPVETRDALLPLLDTFQRLVRLTWSKGNNEDFLGRVAKYAQRQKWASLLKAFQTAVQKASPSTNSALCGKCASVTLLQHPIRVLVPQVRPMLHALLLHVELSVTQRSITVRRRLFVTV